MVCIAYDIFGIKMKGILYSFYDWTDCYPTLTCCLYKPLKYDIYADRKFNPSSPF